MGFRQGAKNILRVIILSAILMTPGVTDTAVADDTLKVHANTASLTRPAEFDDESSSSKNNNKFVVSDATEKYLNQASGGYLVLYCTQPNYCRASTGTSSDVYWRVHVWNDGTVRLQHVFTLKCLRTISGSDYVHATSDSLGCNSSTAQSWWVKKWNDGTIRFQNQATGTCMEVISGFVYLRGCNSSEAQSWS